MPVEHKERDRNPSDTPPINGRSSEIVSRASLLNLCPE